MISITILLVMLVNGVDVILVIVSPFVASISTSWHVKLAKALLILVSFGATQKDTLGVSLSESTLYVRLTALMVALLLSVNRT